MATYSYASSIPVPVMYKSRSSPYFTDNHTPYVNRYNMSQYNSAVNKANYYESQIGGFKSEYDRAYNEAKAANEARYAEILGDYDSMLSMTERLGDQAKVDIGNTYRKMYASGTQSLVNAGMANSTIMPSLARQTTTEQNNALASLNEMLRREKLGILQQKTNFKERREDAYPDASMYTNMMMTYGNMLGNMAYPTYRK